MNRFAKPPHFKDPKYLDPTIEPQPFPNELEQMKQHSLTGNEIKLRPAIAAGVEDSPHYKFHKLKSLLGRK